MNRYNYILKVVRKANQGYLNHKKNVPNLDEIVKDEQDGLTTMVKYLEKRDDQPFQPSNNIVE